MKKPELIIIGIDGALPGYIKEEVKRGKLPGFSRLIDRGVFFEDMMPAFPSITPTCWSAISCGAVPRITGALCHQVHVNGTHPTKYRTPYNSTNIKAERFWEAAARIGKRSLIIDTPCSGPAKCEGVFQIMGGTTYSPDRCPAESYKSGVPQQIFKNDSKEFTVDTKKTRAGTYEDVKGTCDAESKGNETFIFSPVYSDKRYDPNEVEKHEWWVIKEKKGIKFGVDERDARLGKTLSVGEWTEVITRRLKTSDGLTVPFHFRARLDEFDEQNGKFTVFVTGAKNFYKEITPHTFAEEVALIPECFAPDYSAIQAKNANLDKFFESEKFAFKWSEEVISICVNKYAPDIIFDYHERIDALNHRFRNAYEGVKVNYEGEQDLAKEAFRRAYEQTDEHISWILDNIAGENTTVVLLSDHGSIGQSECFHPWKILEDAGLLSVREKTDALNWKSDIDWTKTKAYPVGSCYINVNLLGREPTGIVPEKDYEKTVAEIITALGTHAHAKDGEKIALAFAVSGNQAGFVGHGGENCGDVVYGLCGSHVGGYIGGVHSHQIPSAKSKTGDIRALCLISGPKFKSGASLQRPADLTDIAPTLCFALGYPQPKDATGGIVFGALKEQK